ncbi:MAG: hypothetical protein U1D30_20770 [Planctomycetota bacterium]
MSITTRKLEKIRASSARRANVRTDSPPQLVNQKDTGIETLRGIAITLVVVYHVIS